MLADMQTAVSGGGPLLAHVADGPVYTAPASRYIPLAPAGHVFVAPPGRVVIPIETSSGIGISADHHA
jgi:hypothetical protein